MKQWFFFGITLLLSAGIVMAVYLAAVYEKQPFFSPQLAVKNISTLPGSDFEEELVFYLARQLGIYKGEFEIIDIVSLNTNVIIGKEYLLITVRAPNGDICQVTVVKGAGPWTRWTVIPGSFQVSRIPEASLLIRLDTSPWMRELGVSSEDVLKYFASHPGTAARGEKAFIDLKGGGKYKLPGDWDETIKINSPLRLSVGKNKPVGLSNTMAQNKAGDISSFWKIDYPSEYSGPGYRAYLYNKAKGNN